MLNIISDSLDYFGNKNCDRLKKELNNALVNANFVIPYPSTVDNQPTSRSLISGTQTCRPGNFQHKNREDLKAGIFKLDVLYRLTSHLFVFEDINSFLYVRQLVSKIGCSSSQYLQYFVERELNDGMDYQTLICDRRRRSVSK